MGNAWCGSGRGCRQSHASLRVVSRTKKPGREDGDPRSRGCCAEGGEGSRDPLCWLPTCPPQLAHPFPVLLTPREAGLWSVSHGFPYPPASCWLCPVGGIGRRLLSGRKGRLGYLSSTTPNPQFSYGSDPVCSQLQLLVGPPLPGL